MRTIALLALAVGTAGCASTDIGEFSDDALAAPGVAYSAARRAMGPPQFAPVGTPEALTGGAQHTVPQPAPAAYEAGAPNSLWRTGSRSFFNDQRASRVGDIITVHIEIDDKAEVSNSSNRSREASTSAGVSNFFGLEQAVGQFFNNAFDPENLITTDAESEHTGTGAINREEKIELTR
jgi:flagellar L-ring protein precursor FlgH